MILCIETSTGTCSAALCLDGVIIALKEDSTGHDHASRLGVWIDGMLRDNGGAEVLSAVAVSKGPGSYTGLRIGVSLAKGLCYGLGIPLIGISSLEALAWLAADELRKTGGGKANEIFLCPMTDARRMEVYAQVFDSSLQPVTEVGAHIITAESFAEFRNPGRRLIIFGDGAAKCAGLLEGTQLLDVIPSAAGIAPLAQKALDEGRFENTAYFEPYYLKDFMVTTSAKKFF